MNGRTKRIHGKLSSIVKKVRKQEGKIKGRKQGKLMKYAK